MFACPLESLPLEFNKPDRNKVQNMQSASFSSSSTSHLYIHTHTVATEELDLDVQKGWQKDSSPLNPHSKHICRISALLQTLTSHFPVPEGDARMCLSQDFKQAGFSNSEENAVTITNGMN